MKHTTTSRRQGGAGPRKPARDKQAPAASPAKPAKLVKPARAGKPSRPVKPSKPAIVYPVTEPTELLVFLLAKLAGQGRNSVKSLLAHGQISVDDRVETKYNHPLKPGQIVTVSKDRKQTAPGLIGLRILHEDDDVIVVYKDAGLLSIASPQETEITAYRQLTAHVRLTNANNRIFVLHRLDRETSGIMMFAKSERVQQKMQENWSEVVKERSYVALVEGLVKKSQGTITSWVKESSTLKMYSSQHPNDGQHAVTHYKVLKASRNYSLLEVNLETGRKNQIRVHMQDIGHPVVGDKKYGAKSKAIGRLGLHARVLSFEHPSTGEVMRFESPIPKAFLSQFGEDSQ